LLRRLEWLIQGWHVENISQGDVLGNSLPFAERVRPDERWAVSQVLPITLRAFPEVTLGAGALDEGMGT